jgi:hypothetical protein
MPFARAWAAVGVYCINSCGVLRSVGTPPQPNSSTWHFVSTCAASSAVGSLVLPSDAVSTTYTHGCRVGGQFVCGGLSFCHSLPACHTQPVAASAVQVGGGGALCICGGISFVSTDITGTVLAMLVNNNPTLFPHTRMCMQASGVYVA